MKNTFKKIFAVLVMAMMFINTSTTTRAVAATSSAYQRAAAAAAAKKAAEEAAAKKAAEAAYISKEVSKLESQISDAQKEISATNGQIDSTQTAINDLKTQISVEEENLNREQEKQNKILVAWYMEGDNSGLFNAMLNSNSLSEAVTKEEYYESVRMQIVNTMEKIALIKTELVAKKTDQEKQIVVLQSLRDEQASQQLSLENNRYYKQRLLNNANNAVADYEKIAADELRKEQEAEGEIRRMELAAASGKTGTLSGVSAEGFSWPVVGTLGCVYGYSDDYFKGVFHTGIDLKAYAGADIFSAKAGTVIEARDGMGNTYPSSKSYGNYVMIRHEGGAITLYGHLLKGSLNVSVGDTIGKGVVIGQMGNTGYSTGPHLHFEMRNSDGDTVNPLSYLP